MERNAHAFDCCVCVCVCAFLCMPFVQVSRGGMVVSLSVEHV